MTVFIVSLFLPKTVHFDLPGTPPNAGRPVDRLARGERRKRSTLSGRDAQNPSLFNADITPPESPIDVTPLDPFANEDGFIAYPRTPNSGSPTRFDKASPKWGGSKNQPVSRVDSPPRAPLSEQARTAEKARQLGRQGVTQPQALVRSESHDRVFAHANWRIANAEQGNGGLRNAAEAAHREGRVKDFTWVGTLGMPTDVLAGTQQQQDIEDRLAMEHNMLTVWCSDKDFDGHYSHFCKQILWPVFHYQIPDSPKSKAYEDHSWKYYVNVNQAFADQIVKNWKRGDVVWVHDYHLLLVPGMVRAKLPEAKIGFFLHVAFPSSEVFRCLAVRNELLHGILGANMVGFQIHEYTRHFLQTCSRLLSAEATPEGLQLEDRFVDVINMPIGIDPVNLAKHRQNDSVRRWIEVLTERYRGKRLIVARDKLDNVRGVRQKLLSYELFLNKNPKWRDNTVLIQVALSGSENADLDATVSDIVTRVNSSWANLAYQPVVYLKQDIDYSQYLALLTIADALMITSQREGMNLTSHEFLVCQDGEHFPEKKHGSLILSEFTGTSSIFGGVELVVNPWDYRQCAEAIQKALEMSDEEKSERWNKLYTSVMHHTGENWFTEFLARLDRVYEEQHRRDQTTVPRLSMSTLCRQYEQSTRRLFILDYEGTLVSWGPVTRIIPVSPQRTVHILIDLLADERNTVYVMSGRRPEELDRQFKRVPNLGLIAENGCFVKDTNTDVWTTIADTDQILSWKEPVKEIMTYYLERAPGAEVEERRCSLIFHYKSADDYESAARLAQDCAAHINDACEEQRVHAVPMDGHMVVEPIDWTKSTAAEQVFRSLKRCMGPQVPGPGEGQRGVKGPVDFMMVVGDGRDDEKVFRWANALKDNGTVKEVVTACLGSRSTEATATIGQGVNGVLLALQKLAQMS